MDIEKYKRRLLELEKRLANRVAREREGAVEQVLDTAADTGDASVASRPGLVCADRCGGSPRRHRGHASHVEQHDLSIDG